MGHGETVRICPELKREIEKLQRMLSENGLVISKVAASRLLARGVNPDAVFRKLIIKFRRNEIRL